MTALSPALRARLYRWRWWVLALGLLITIRVTLPLVARRVLASYASQALHAQVDIGNVDLALLRGGVVLEDVTVRALAPHATAISTAPSLPNPPLIAWKRLDLQLRYPPLFRKTIRLRQVRLDSPQVALDRLQDGSFNLLALVPNSGAVPAPTPPSAPAEAAKAAWGFGIDKLVLTSGALRFRDLMVKDSEAIEVDLDDIEVGDFSLRPGLYGEPSHTHVLVEADQGSVAVDADLTVSDAGFALDATVDAQSLSLQPARVYIPRVGWSTLEGRLDCALTYRLETGTSNEVRGTVAVRDLQVQLPNLHEPVLAWRTLTGHVDPLDLAAHRLVVTDSELTGASLLVHPDASVPVPLLTMNPMDTAPDPNTPPAVTAAADAGSDTATTPSPPAAAPWQWAVTRFQMTDSRLHVLGSQGAAEVEVSLGANDFAEPAEQPAHIEVALTGAGGSVNAAGALRLRPPGFAGKLRIADLSLPPLIALAPAAPQEMLEAARLDTDLTIEAGLASDPASQPRAARDVHLSGRLSLAEPRLRAAASRPAFAAQSIDLTVQALDAPNVLPAWPGGAESATEPSPLQVQAGLIITQPQLTATVPQELSLDAESINLAITDLAARGLLSRLHAAPEARSASDVHTQGKLSVAGLRLSAPGPQGFSAAIKSIELTLSELVAAGLLAAGDAGATSAASTGDAGITPGDLRLRGLVGVTEARLTGADAKVFAAGIGTLDLPITEITLPAILPGAIAGGTVRPLKVTLGALRVTAPTVQATRTAEGLLLQQFALSSPSATAGQAPPAAPPAASPTRLEAGLESVKVTGGRIEMLDRAVTPFFRGVLTQLNVELGTLRWPALAATELHAVMHTPEQGTVEVFGGLSPNQDAWLQLYATDVALLPFNPYTTHYSSYSIAQGHLVLSSKVAARQGRYTAENSVRLRDFELQGAEGDSLFQRQFGVPLTMALALMRDYEGNIDLNVPVESGTGGTTVDVLAVVGKALRQALLSTLESPLKLVGAVFGGDSAQSVTPMPISFRLGRAELTPDGATQVERLGTLLASRPGIGVGIEVTTSSSDVRWLREQALRTAWEGQGMVDKLRGLTQRSTRNTVQKALEARAKNEPGDLEGDDAAALDHWLDERPPISSDQLLALANARLTLVAAALHDDAGIDAVRITRHEPSGEPSEAAPIATIQLGTR